MYLSHNAQIIDCVLSVVSLPLPLPFGWTHFCVSQHSWALSPFISQSKASKPPVETLVRSYDFDLSSGLCNRLKSDMVLIIIVYYEKHFLASVTLLINLRTKKQCDPSAFES